jgi:hypothetical protein
VGLQVTATTNTRLAGGDGKGGYVGTLGTLGTYVGAAYLLIPGRLEGLVQPPQPCYLDSLALRGDFPHVRSRVCESIDTIAYCGHRGWEGGE